jgi:glycosyltransferase involved in cell wall biosynthesis
MKTKPLVSVIIPTYNRAFEVHHAIESVLNQNYPNIQLIVVDDGSADETPKVISNYPQVEYHFQKNQGQAAARNTGLQYTKGTFIASLDSDDTWGPDFLDECVGKMENEQLDFVFANWNQSSKAGDWTDFLEHHGPLKPYVKETEDSWINLNNTELRALYLKTCPSPSSSVLMRKSSIISGWNTQMNIGDDWCLLLDMVLTKPCNAAFTLKKLWKKHVGEMNIYDGRRRIEVVKLLYIEDTSHLMQRYNGYLTKPESRILLKRYIRAMVEHAKYSLTRDLNIFHCFKLLKQSLSANSILTLTSLSHHIRKSSKRRMLKLTSRLT